MASSTDDYQGGYIWDCDLHQLVRSDRTPVSQCPGDAPRPGDATNVDEPKSAAEVRLTTETPVPENGSGDLMDVDGQDFVTEVAFKNETQALEANQIYTQPCFPGQMGGVDGNSLPSSDGLPKVPDPSEGQAWLASQASLLWSRGGGQGLDLILDEIIDDFERRNSHGSRNGARVGKGHNRDAQRHNNSRQQGRGRRQ